MLVSASFREQLKTTGRKRVTRNCEGCSHRVSMVLTVSCRTVIVVLNLQACC